jgi:hypothetical protein
MIGSVLRDKTHRRYGDNRPGFGGVRPLADSDVETGIGISCMPFNCGVLLDASDFARRQ